MIKTHRVDEYHRFGYHFFGKLVVADYDTEDSIATVAAFVESRYCGQVVRVLTTTPQYVAEIK